MDHINETKLIHDAYVRMKNSVPPGRCSGKSKQEIDALQVHMQAELCDLYLLLAKHFKNSPLVDARSRKFYEKSGEQYPYDEQYPHDDGDAE